MATRILQVVKTVDGANWAVDQVTELVGQGFEVHVALPALKGLFIDAWRASGAQIHHLDIGLPLRSPWRFSKKTKSEICGLVAEVAPDLIHSHFVNSTLALRYALGRDHPLPRVFQVPGPFHMEHPFFRRWELSSAGANDYWVASSRYTRKLYMKAGIDADRLYLSYYGNRHPELSRTRGAIRSAYGIGEDQLVVGNINYMYAPRLYFGHTKGIKRHEDVIDALAEVTSRRNGVVGLIIGGQWGGEGKYEARLKARAAGVGADRIKMTGWIPAEQAKSAWVDFDVAVHVPVSENCGGVIEPLMADVPVIAARTGGLPEVILDGITGKLVPPKDPRMLASAITEVLDNLPRFRSTARQGHLLVDHMFDVRRTAAEVGDIYRHLLDSSLPRPAMFDSAEYLKQVSLAEAKVS